MKTRSIAAALLGALAFAAAAVAQTPRETRPAPAAPAPSVQAPVTPTPAPSLNKADLEGWLDGFMPYAIASGDIAGAVVVVVMDGLVLTEKGYGYADVKSKRPVDPRSTLFRPGSVSKLYTWTAVMQLVEQGKLDLDADINRYLDFKIPPRDGQPVTLRNIMTHTPGFAEKVKHLFPLKAERLQPLDVFLKNWTPHRIYPPGETPAYSNYGAGLAGYIVQRVSGEPFEQYVDRHIFQPLGMAHSSFLQPLPKALTPGMASGYMLASQDPKPYELVQPGPAGSLASTGEDMARFMIAHLNKGQFGSAQILKPETIAQMYAPQIKHAPPLNGMALGFYHEDRNGHVIVGHGGDLVVFHSDLHLLPADNVGIYISMNSAGKGSAVTTIRQALLQDFMDRYFPAAPQNLPTAPTAKEHAKLMAGTYWSSRRVDSGFLRLVSLISQSKVTARDDGTITVKGMDDAGGAPIVWREVGPFYWQDATGKHHLAALVKDGKVVHFAEDDDAAIIVNQPVPGWANSSWNLPLLGAMVAVLLATVVLWPIQAIVRWRHRQRFPLSGRTALLYRLVRATALVDLIVLGGFLMIVQSVSSGGLGIFDDPLDIWLRLLQLLCLLGVIGAGLAVWNAVRVWGERGRSWWAKTSVTLIAAACLAFVWFVVTLQLVSPSLNY
jgi:CubicO group peptidase (beta-lactamase class C family)